MYPAESLEQTRQRRNADPSKKTVLAFFVRFYTRLHLVKEYLEYVAHC